MAPRATTDKDPLYVAGIGASAGGLDAMLEMLAHLPVNGRITYVIAQHMAHDAHSDLVERLLARESRLPLAVARDGDKLEAGRVYLLPTDRDGVVKGNTLALLPPSAEYLSHPAANALFASLALAHQGNAIGIVLSGTGSDGVAGCRAIKAAGGLTLAQDPQEAKFDGMPSAAIAARVIDRILPATAIGAVLAAHCGGAMPEPGSMPPAPPEISPGKAELRELAYLVGLVNEATGIDFSGYKEETLLRRLQKRKEALGVASADAYLALIRHRPEELHTLQHLFLVSMSSFFRDRDAFRELARALAPLLAAKPDGEPVRAWVPGCATGEEAYSLAIILHDLLGERRNRHPVLITATDLNPEALERARAATYLQPALREMDAELVNRHFVRDGENYVVSDTLRAMVTFERRDVLGGPPGTELDLVSCRNLLIYLKGDLQDRLVADIHRALRPGGLLFIGQSESPGLAGNTLFAPVERFHRLFRRRS